MPPPDTIVNCSNLASFRHLILSAAENTSEMYPHNAFIPLLFTVRDLQSIPLHELSYILNTARSSYSLHHVVQGYKLVTQSVTTFLVSPHAHENLVASNVFASRILESDWSGVGGGKTVSWFKATRRTALMTDKNGELILGHTVILQTQSKSQMRWPHGLGIARSLDAFKPLRLQGQSYFLRTATVPSAQPIHHQHIPRPFITRWIGQTFAAQEKALLIHLGLSPAIPLDLFY